MPGKPGGVQFDFGIDIVAVYFLASIFIFFIILLLVEMFIQMFKNPSGMTTVVEL